MRMVGTALMLCAMAAPLAAQQRVDFWRVREGAQVVLVLGTGGECRGVVSQRTDGALAVRVAERSAAACGAAGSTVSVREQDTRSVERAEAPRSASLGKKVAAVAVAAGAGVLALAGPRTLALGAIGGGAEAVHLMNRDLDKREQTKNAYVLYVSRLS